MFGFSYIMVLIRKNTFRVKLSVFIVLAIFALFTPVLGQHPCINELLSDNTSGIMDDDGDYVDWIEIFNPNSQAMNLENYGLSDDAGLIRKWLFPSVNIEAGGYMIVFASGKNRTNPQQALHTNFSINAQGEALYFTSPDGGVVNVIAAACIQENNSFGRFPDGIDEWMFFMEPTPGAPNNTQGFGASIAPPYFSHSAGFYAQDFNLILSHPDPAAVILYTLDGSQPCPSNLQGAQYQYKNKYIQFPGQTSGELLNKSIQSFLYQQEFLIQNRSLEQDKLTHISSTYHSNPPYFPVGPVRKGTVVKARAFKEGFLPSQVVTHTFFIEPDGQNPFVLPVISLSVQENRFFDYEEGIYVAGKTFDLWREANPNQDAYPHSPANYRNTGDEWEVPAYFEFFETNQTNPVLSQGVGVRIHGGATRAAPVKPLRVYAAQRYGTPTLNHQFFEELHHSEFKRILLRNSGNDAIFTYLRDVAIHRIVSPLIMDKMESRPSLLFLNGEFWGIYNMRERYDKYYLQRNYGVDAENLDLLELWGLPEEGDPLHYQQMLNYLEENDLSLSSNYEYINTLMDVQNYIDYQIAEIFSANTDWPAVNVAFWRLRTPQYEPSAPLGHDGRWRWLFFDIDFGFSGYYPSSPSHNTLEYATMENSTHWANAQWSTFLIRKLLQNESFRIDFINRFADLLNTVFLPQRMVAIITAYKELYQPHMPEHILRWKSLIGSMTAWEARVNLMIAFANQRPDFQRQHIREFFNISQDEKWIHIDVNDAQQGYVRINTIDLIPGQLGLPDTVYPWAGKYFHGIPITLKAFPKQGFKFSHWEGSLVDSNCVITIIPSQDLNIKACFVQEEVPDMHLIHYWHFNDLPSGNLDVVLSDFSITNSFPAFITYPGQGNGYLDRRTHNAENPVSDLNLHMGQLPSQGAVLRARNPAHSRELIINAPSVGYSGIIVNFAIVRSSNGLPRQEFYFSADGGQNWQLLQQDYVVGQLNTNLPQNGWMLKSFDLSEIPQVNNNPYLMFKILFIGEYPGNVDEGNVRFDNISVHGQVYSNILPSESGILLAYPNPFVDKVVVNNLSPGSSIEIYDAQGRLVFCTRSTLIKTEIDLKELPAGLYVIKAREFLTDKPLSTRIIKF